MTQERLAGWEGEVVVTPDVYAFLDDQFWMSWLVDEEREQVAKLVVTLRRDARLAAIEECAKVADERADAYRAIPNPILLNAARLGEAERIAQAIRNLAPPPPPAVVGEGG